MDYKKFVIDYEFELNDIYQVIDEEKENIDEKIIKTGFNFIAENTLKMFNKLSAYLVNNYPSFNIIEPDAIDELVMALEKTDFKELKNIDRNFYLVHLYTNSSLNKHQDLAFEIMEKENEHKELFENLIYGLNSEYKLEDRCGKLGKYFELYPASIHFNANFNYAQMLLIIDEVKALYHASIAFNAVPYHLESNNLYHKLIKGM